MLDNNLLRDVRKLKSSHDGSYGLSIKKMQRLLLSIEPMLQQIDGMFKEVKNDEDLAYNRGIFEVYSFLRDNLRDMGIYL